MSTTDEPLSKIRKIENCELKQVISVKPVLSDDFLTEKVPTRKFYAIQVPDKRLIGVIIKLVKDLPEDLNHLKRVNKDGRLLIGESLENAETVITKLAHDSIKIDDIQLIDVPSIKPFTRDQFEFAKTLWPTSFTCDKTLEGLIDGTFLDSELRVYVEKWSRMAEDNECLVIQNGQILSEGRSKKGPLRHAVMEMTQVIPKREPSSENYLGTGCDVFLKNEPCAMCAMALVHFRIKRVFFNSQSSNGVLKSSKVWKLHLEPLINHHYEVFHVILN